MRRPGRHERLLRLLFLGLVLAGVLLSVGCPASTKQEYKYRVAVIPKGLTHEFWQSIERGAKRAGEDLTGKGISTQILWDGPLKENDTLEQISIIDRNIAKGVSGIVLAPQHSETMVAPVERAVKEGIPVLIIDSARAPAHLVPLSARLGEHRSAREGI